MDSLGILRKYWKYDTFRPLQSTVIDSILAGNDTLALMPTGGGKSLCFQVPAMQQDGICIVVTPLIALMKDQVENLKARGIEAEAIFSGMSKREVDIAFDNCIYGPVKFLYLSPERLNTELAQERIRHMKVNLYAIDEAHCISQWGYDFRPPYLQLTVLRDLHPQVPILALTATATSKVVYDIQDKLGFREHNVLRKSFVRENLAYMVLNEEDKLGRMLRVIRKIGGSGIVYVRNRRETQEITRMLINEGLSATYYHAGLDTPERSRRQEEWKSNKIRVIVATNAFGMGIDKPDVRFVIHLDIPESLEAYYQEAGRAGRDEKKSFAVMLYHESDILLLRKNLEQSFPSLSEIKHVYHLLANYFQLAYGAGEGLVLDFDIGEFCNRYKLEAIKTLNALKFLERDGWISVSEAVYLPSRLQFEVDMATLYKFQVEHAVYDSFIKMVLRAYGGAFDHYIPIREGEFAKKIGRPYMDVVNKLKHLHQQGIIHYIPQTDSPQLQFLRARVDAKHLHIDANYLSERKRTKTEQVNEMLRYLDRHQCRSIQLLSYFDELDSPMCGVCDVCLQSRQRQEPDSVVANHIEHTLVSGPLTIQQLMDVVTSGTEDAKMRIIREMIDEGRIAVESEYYRLTIKK